MNTKQPTDRKPARISDRAKAWVRAAMLESGKTLSEFSRRAVEKEAMRILKEKKKREERKKYAKPAAK